MTDRGGAFQYSDKSKNIYKQGTHPTLTGNTAKFFEKYIDPNTGSQDLFSSEWELEETIRTYGPLVRAQNYFENETFPVIIEDKIRDVVFNGFDIGESIEVKTQQSEIPGNRIGINFLPDIIPPFAPGTVFAIARTNFYPYFDVTVTRSTTHTFFVEGVFFYKLLDTFEDAADFGDDVDGNQEFIDGFAYELYAEWAPIEFSMPISLA